MEVQILICFAFIAEIEVFARYYLKFHSFLSGKILINGIPKYLIFRVAVEVGRWWRVARGVGCW